MRPVVQVSGYQTSDGHVYPSQEVAEEAQFALDRALALRQFVDRHFGHLDGFDKDDIFDALRDYHYELEAALEGMLPFNEDADLYEGDDHEYLELEEEPSPIQRAVEDILSDEPRAEDDIIPF